MVFSLMIMFGWVMLQSAIRTPKDKTNKDETVEQKVDWNKYGAAAVATNLVASRGLILGSGLDEILLTQDLFFTPPVPRRPAYWEELDENKKKIATILAYPMGALFEVAIKKPVVAEADVIPFGGENSYIQGLFTTRGAGVQKLTLNKFKAANWLGERAKGELELIPDDPQQASFLMYHYPFDVANEFNDKVDESGKIIKRSNPVDTLGWQIWKLESNKTLGDGTQEVRFSTHVPEEAYRHIRIVKTFRLLPHAYHLTLLLEFFDERDPKDSAKNPIPFRYQLAGAHGMPIEGIFYTATYRDSVIGQVDKEGSLVRTKEDANRISFKKGGEKVQDKGDSLQYAGVVNQNFAALIVVDNVQPTAAEGGVDMKKILSWARPTEESIEIAGLLTNIEEKSIWVEEPGRPAQSYVLLPHVKKHMEEIELKKDTKVVIGYYEYYRANQKYRVVTWIRPGEVPKPYLNDLTVRVSSDIINLAPGKKTAHQYMLYHGPLKVMLLRQFGGDMAVDPELVDRYTHTLHLRTLTDYRSAGPLGTFSQTIHFTDLLIAVTNLMHWLLYYLHMLVGNYGLTIILLTVIVRGLMFPISRKQAYFSVKMQEIAPELKKIKEKYGTDRQAQTQATMELYRKHKVHPLGSCLPLVMQMPIFLGLYYALQESIHFRLAGFLWIDNLAAPDMLKWWTEKIPWISNPDNQAGSFPMGLFYLGPFLNILPLVAVGFMIVQQKIMTPPPVDEQQEMQQKMMKYMMAFMGLMFYKVASGLCLYFIATSLWGLAERKLLPKKKMALAVAGQTPAAGKPMIPPPKGKGAKGKFKKDEKVDGKVQKVKDWWAELLKQAKKK